MGKRKMFGKMKCLITIVFVFMIFLLSCKKEIKDNKNIIIRDNPRAYTKWDEVFTDHKVIRFKGLKEDDQLVDVRGFAMNSKGEYFIQDSKKNSIVYFSKSGNLIKLIGRSGEGPGEAIMPAMPRFDKDDNLFIFDLIKRKMIEFLHPEYNFYKEFNIGETFYDFFISPDNKIIATTPYAVDNFIIHKYNMNGKPISSAFLPNDIKLSKFIVTFGIYSLGNFDKNIFLYIFPTMYKIYRYDYNLNLIKTYTTEKETEYFPFRGHFPYGETPYGLTKKNQKWWESKYVPIGVESINKNYFIVKLVKFKKYNYVDKFVNIHSFKGKTIGKEIRIPFEGIIRYVKDGYVYVMESDRVDRKTGDIIPQTLHRYKFKFD